MSGTELAFLIVLGVLGLIWWIIWWISEIWLEFQKEKLRCIREDARKERERMEREK